MAMSAQRVTMDRDVSHVKQLEVFWIINNDFLVMIMPDLEALKAPLELKWTLYEKPSEEMG